MASGHVNRTKRPNTWLHRPASKREEKPCQLGAVHTWHIATNADTVTLRPLSSRDRPSFAAVATAGMCHVWTAPSWQGFSSRLQAGRCSHVFGLFVRFT